MKKQVVAKKTKTEKRELTQKQRKFIEFHSGNGTEAARKAGYQGNDNVLGVTSHELLRNPKIVQEIQNRNNKELAPVIATRQERQSFWTKVMNDESKELRDRLKASELLGKSQTDFIQKLEHTGKDGGPIEMREAGELSDEELREKIEANKKRIEFLSKNLMKEEVNGEKEKDKTQAQTETKTQA